MLNFKGLSFAQWKFPTATSRSEGSSAVMPVSLFYNRHVAVNTLKNIQNEYKQHLAAATYRLKASCDGICLGPVLPFWDSCRVWMLLLLHNLIICMYFTLVEAGVSHEVGPCQDKIMLFKSNGLCVKKHHRSCYQQCAFCQKFSGIITLVEEYFLAAALEDGMKEWGNPNLTTLH